uniref:Transposon Ty3-I Gag-Pol polyprotein n=1 Tax=Schistocephalus solidus TaxID=70667 RepID=A0A0X3PXJ8_SCHSO
MLSRNIIRPSHSPWSSPIVLVRKKDGSMRLCIDYRKLNSVTKKDSFPLPRIDATLDTLAGNTIFSTLDLASGYWQVEVRPADREKTAFAVPSGLYEFETMPFGLANAPSTFQRLMNQVLSQLIPNTCLVYMDDIIVLGKDFNNHLENLRSVFESLRQAGLTLKPSKCIFIKPRVKFLGHIVSAKGIETDDEKIRQIRDWPTPTDVSEVRSFLGLASYYRRFIKDYAHIASPLHKLTQKDVKFKWAADCATSFQTLKDKLCSSPILVFPNISSDAGKFVLDTDASDNAIGAVLSQQQPDGTERVIQYLSCSLTKAERRYCVTRKEMLALTYFVEECRPYLLYRPFIVRTDHSSLTWLRNFKNPEGQVARWQEKLAEYEFECVFRPGRQHGNSDALSRKPYRPHGECPSCTDVTISAVALQTDQCLLWAAAQRDDPHISPIYSRKVSNARPLSKSELAGYSYETRCLHSLWDKLFIENGVLFYRDSEQYPKRVVLPLSMVDEVVERMHAELGHSGIHKTEWALRRRYFWPNQKRDIQDVIRSCEFCLASKSPNQALKAPLQPIKTGYPNERVGVDLVGPIAPSAKGNKFILVMVDFFTKMAEAVPLPDASAATVAKAIFNCWVCRWGAPDQIHSDRGSSFESAVVLELCKFLKIKKTRTTAYHPQGNGQVERTNRTLLNLLRAFIDRSATPTWDDAIPACMLAYRSTVNATTRHTPFFLTCGREMQLPEDLHLPTAHRMENVDTYASRLRRTLRVAFEEARLHLQEGQRQQKAYYDRLAHGTPYQAGDIVWMRNFAASAGVPPKFNPAWVGPYVVTRVL